MAATVSVCPVASSIGLAKSSRTEIGMHSSPMMMMARCHTCPTSAYCFAPYACVSSLKGPEGCRGLDKGVN